MKPACADVGIITGNKVDAAKPEIGEAKKKNLGMGQGHNVHINHQEMFNIGATYDCLVVLLSLLGEKSIKASPVST